MFEVVVLSSASRQLKKFDKAVRNAIIAGMEKIAENPYTGDRLKGNLATIYSYHLNVANVEYRIAYQIREQEIVVIVLQIGTRENFYEELKKRFS